MADVYDELRKMYPQFIFKNKTRLAQPVSLADGDSVQVHGGGTLKLDSSKFHQFPDKTKFTYLQPTLDDLRAVGLLASPVLPVVAQKKPETPTE